MKTPQHENRKYSRFFILVLTLFVICAGISYLTAHLVMSDGEWKHDQSHGHDWLKAELGLNEQESKDIDSFEVAYREKRHHLEAEFHDHISHLAQLIRDNDSMSPDVVDAVHALHGVHGELQQLSIEHYYEMLSVLPPDKQESLRELAVEALSQPE